MTEETKAVDKSLNQLAREATSVCEKKFQNTTPVVDPNSNNNTENEKSIFIATEFLKEALPKFIEQEMVSKNKDRLVKVGRNLVDLVTLADTCEISARNEEFLTLELENIVEECDILTRDDLQVPKVRFGKTEIQMPIVTLGCMRFQQTWANNIKSMDQVDCKGQENVRDIFEYAITKLGINHIETANMYGCSELQIGQVLQDLYKENVTKREDLIIQTKVNPMPPQAFRDTLDASFANLQVDYLDLFSFHGINFDYHYDLIFNNSEGENLIDIIREYQHEGKIKHVGFSSHGQPELIRRFIETDQFEYVNLHYHYFGSYTASGEGQFGGNLENIRLMKQKDMGVFVISAYDKGGKLYAPSKKLRSLTLPELEPIQFGSLWLWAHEELDEENAPIHTFTVGAARPSDLDEPAAEAYLFKNKKELMMKKVKTVVKKLDDAQVDALGKDWVKTWHKGVPNVHTEDEMYMFGHIVSLYNQIKSFGMLDYAKDRYEPFDNNLSNWNMDLPPKENIAKSKVMWGYMPGIATKPGVDYSDHFTAVPEENKARVIEAIEFVHKHCSKLSDKSNLDVPKDWETAYDMRPWCAFPERK